MSDNSSPIRESNGPTSYFSSSLNDIESPSKNTFTNIQVVPAPQREQGLEIYKLLEENCNLFFLKNINADKFLFDTEKTFAIFASNDKGSFYGTIGGIGDIQEDNYPIGYVSNDDKCGIVASNLKEFLQLIVFYPFWLELLNCSDKERRLRIKVLEEKSIENIPNYLENQNIIINNLCLEKKDDAIDALLSNLKESNFFIVYRSDNKHIRYENLLNDYAVNKK